MAHEDYKEMLPALALSALDEVEARTLNLHLSECAECRSELADWESTAAALALTVDPVEPSGQVRDRMMSAVRNEQQSQRDGRVVPFPGQQRRNVLTRFGRVGAVAAVVLFAVLIIWIVVLWQQNRALQRDNDSLAHQNRWMEKELTRSDQFVRILSAPGAKYTLLHGSEQADAGTGHLVYDRTGRAMLMVDGLPPTPAGKEYQLWFIVGKNPPIPGGTFVPDDVGRAELTAQVPEQALDSAVFAVTLEPAGGSTAPTGAIYLRGSL